MNDAAPVRPFPFEALPRVSREELARGRRLRRAARRIRVDAVMSALTELTGEPVSIANVRVRAFELAAVPSTGVAVAFAPPDAPGMGQAGIIDVEMALANTLLARALRQRVPRVTDASRSPAPEVAGAFAALLHTALRRAHDLALRVVAAGPAPALLRDLAGVHHRVVTAWLTVAVSGEAFDARVTVPDAELSSATGADAVDLAASLSPAMPVALPLVLATCIAGRAALDGLRPGDAFVLPRTVTADLRVESGTLVGPVALGAARSERGLTGVLAEGGVLRTGTVASLVWDRAIVPFGGAHEKSDPNMPGEMSRSPTLEVLEDAPIVVRVELGVVEMKLRDWAELAPGDVVAIGRKLGDPASLRVGGVEIARGELVQVDGEYGVRILATSSSGGRAGGT